MPPRPTRAARFDKCGTNTVSFSVICSIISPLGTYCGSRAKGRLILGAGFARSWSTMESAIGFSFSVVQPDDTYQQAADRHRYDSCVLGEDWSPEPGANGALDRYCPPPFLSA